MTNSDYIFIYVLTLFTPFFLVGMIMYVMHPNKWISRFRFWFLTIVMLLGLYYYLPDNMGETECFTNVLADELET